MDRGGRGAGASKSGKKRIVYSSEVLGRLRNGRLCQTQLAGINPIVATRARHRSSATGYDDDVRNLDRGGGRDSWRETDPRLHRGSPREGLSDSGPKRRGDAGAHAGPRDPHAIRRDAGSGGRDRGGGGGGGGRGRNGGAVPEWAMDEDISQPFVMKGFEDDQRKQYEADAADAKLRKEAAAYEVVLAAQADAETATNDDPAGFISMEEDFFADHTSSSAPKNSTAGSSRFNNFFGESDAPSDDVAEDRSSLMRLFNRGSETHAAHASATEPPQSSMEEGHFQQDTELSPSAGVEKSTPAEPGPPGNDSGGASLLAGLKQSRAAWDSTTSYIVENSEGKSQPPQAPPPALPTQPQPWQRAAVPSAQQDVAAPADSETASRNNLALLLNRMAMAPPPASSPQQPQPSPAQASTPDPQPREGAAAPTQSSAAESSSMAAQMALLNLLTQAPSESKPQPPPTTSSPAPGDAHAPGHPPEEPAQVPSVAGAGTAPGKPNGNPKAPVSATGTRPGGAKSGPSGGSKKAARAAKDRGAKPTHEKGAKPVREKEKGNKSTSSAGKANKAAKGSTSPAIRRSFMPTSVIRNLSKKDGTAVSPKVHRKKRNPPAAKAGSQQQPTQTPAHVPMNAYAMPPMMTQGHYGGAPMQQQHGLQQPPPGIFGQQPGLHYPMMNMPAPGFPQQMPQMHQMHQPPPMDPQTLAASQLNLMRLLQMPAMNLPQ